MKIKFMKIVAFFAWPMLLACSFVQAIQAQDVLKDGANETVTGSGVPVRKGTIYATILNTRHFESLILEEDSLEKGEQIDEIIQDLSSMIPSLNAVKLFELFYPEEWIKAVPGCEGRILVGLLYFRQYPEKGSVEIVEALKHDYKKNSLELQREVAKTLEILEKQ